MDVQKMFMPGKNIAIKVPPHEYEKTVHFYEVILGFKRISIDESDHSCEAIGFEFGDKNLWIDQVSTISQAEIWLEVKTKDIKKAQQYLRDKGCTFRNDIEILPDSMNAFWLNSPSNIIHLVTE